MYLGAWGRGTRDRRRAAELTGRGGGGEFVRLPRLGGLFESAARSVERVRLTAHDLSALLEQLEDHIGRREQPTGQLLPRSALARRPPVTLVLPTVSLRPIRTVPGSAWLRPRRLAQCCCASPSASSRVIRQEHFSVGLNLTARRP